MCLVQTPLDLLSATKTANPELVAYLKKHNGSPHLREASFRRVLSEEDMQVRRLKNGIITVLLRW